MSEHRPVQLVVLGLLIAALLAVSGSLQRSISDRRRALWDTTTAHPGSPVEPSGPPTDWVYRLRSHAWYRNAFRALTQTILPFVFGFGCLAALALVVTGTANRMWFAARSAAGATCIDAAPPRTWSGEPLTVQFPSNELCQQTGLVVQQGQRYRVGIVLPDEGQWRDASIRVKTPEGFSSGQGPIFLVALPFRRVLTARWFVPMVRIGNHLAEYHRLDQIEEIPPAPGEPRQPGARRKVRGFAEFTPAFTGQMFLFVNDAVLPGPWLKTLYDNNHGTATVTISAIELDLLPAGPSR